MIWPELWLFALAVVLRKKAAARWVNRMVSTHYSDDVHRTGHLHYWGIGVFSQCACPECVAEFDFAFEWVRIQ